MVRMAPTMMSESFLPADGKQPNGDDDVVHQGDEGADGEGQLESQGDIDQDAEHAEAQRHKGTARQFAADEFTCDFFSPPGSLRKLACARCLAGRGAIRGDLFALHGSGDTSSPLIASLVPLGAADRDAVILVHGGVMLDLDHRECPPGGGIRARARNVGDGDLLFLWLQEASRSPPLKSMPKFLSPR